MSDASKLTVFSQPAIARLGRYEVLGRFAEGGMAEVFLARERAPGGATRILALKRMRPHVARDAAVREMFEREGRLAMELRHPNICPVFEYGEDGGIPFLAMEWVHGVALSELIERAPGTLPMEYVLRIVSDVAAALHAAHTARSADGTPLRIVHRDVTPENIMIAFDGTVRLLDFGIAKAAIQRGKTEEGILKGKIGYMAPEQFAKGSAEVDARADVFALGVCFYEALVGKPLFERESHAETMAAIVVGELPAPPSHERADIPMSVDAVFRRAVARHVGDRYATADDFARDLERAAASDPAGPVRATALAALLDAVFPGERDAAPTLDRTPIAGLEQERAKAARDLERPSMEAELDQLSDEVASASKRKQRMLIVLAVAVVLLAALAVAMAVMNAPSPGGPASPVPGAVEP